MNWASLPNTMIPASASGLSSNTHLHQKHDLESARDQNDTSPLSSAGLNKTRRLYFESPVTGSYTYLLPDLESMNSNSSLVEVLLVRRWALEDVGTDSVTVT